MQQQPTMLASPVRLPNGILAWTPEACGTNIVSRTVLSRHLQTHTAYYLLGILSPVFLAPPLPGLSGPLQNTCQCCSLADCRPLGGDYITGQHASHGGDGTRDELTDQRQPVQIIVLSNQEVPDFLFRVLGNAPDFTSFVFQQ